MSECLAEVLSSQADVVRIALEKRLQQSSAAALAEMPGGDAAALLATLAARCEGDPEVAAGWARELREVAEPAGLALVDALEGLRCLESVVRFFLVRQQSDKRALLPALNELSEAVESMRRSVVTEFSDKAASGQPAALVRAVAVAPSREAAVQEDLATLADCAQVAICLATLQGKPFYVNRAGRTLLGLAEATDLPASLHGFYSESSWTQLRDVAVPEVQQQGRWSGNSQVRNAQTGDVHDVATVMYLAKGLQTDRKSCLAIIHNQMREPSQLENALREATARKKAILESSLDPIITIDHEGVITEFNRAAEQTFGHPRSKILGTRPSDVLFPSQVSAGQQNRIERYLEAGEGSMLGRRTEVTAVRADGESFPAEMAMTIGYEQGAPVLTFFVRDISERKKAEQEQARYAAELERSNRELEQFAYVASHDLQEPLRKIRTFGDRLEMKCGSMLDDTGRECIERMQNAAMRMQALIEGLLTLSRVTTRGQKFVPCDLAEVAREVVSDLESTIERAEGRVEIGKLPTIQADPLQMRQLLQNLIGNALKFHRPGTPPIVKVHGRFIQSHDQRGGEGSLANERCRMVVEDNGIGFEQRYLERIFGVFQRLHPREVYEGTGIGLAICRRIAERHGGTIAAQSEPDKGAAFEVLLPVVHPKEKGSRK